MARSRHCGLVRYDAYNEMSGPPVDVDRAAGQLALGHRPVLDPPSRPGAPVRQAGLRGRGRAASSRPRRRKRCASRHDDLMRIGYLGPPGTFSEEARARRARRRRASSSRCRPCATRSSRCATARSTGRSSRSRTRSRAPIGVTLDTLAERRQRRRRSSARSSCRSRSTSSRAAGADPAAIERVLSHPQALGQCARFLREHAPGAELVATSSTAEAVRRRRRARRRWAALGTRRAADLYGAAVLAEAVEDDPGNATRFVWLAPRGATPAGAGAGAAAGEDLAGVLGLGRRQPRLARAVPVGVRLPRREPHEDRVAPAARAGWATTASSSTARAAPATARSPRRSPACARTASTSGSSAPTRPPDRLIRLSRDSWRPSPRHQAQWGSRRSGAPAART